jgi:3-(methylthio)propanoyl-CoA dehydrogenase
MGDFTAPLDDLRFVLENVIDLNALTKLAPFEHTDPDIVMNVLEENARFVEDVIAPLNRTGDEQPSRWDAGSVTTPPGFRDAYDQYVAAGWGGVPFPADYGGGEFPWTVGVALQEILTAANVSFSMCPLLTQGAIDMLLQHGSEEQKERYLSRMVTGEWAGTMNLTEPQAGSDLGALATRATPAEDGTWRISGQKIFITFGEHDLTENIIHLVLARAPDAAPGTKGISTFIVPKYLLNEDGSLGERNGVQCLSIEHKMGVHASPTCVMEYNDAVGYLVGEVNQGMRYMFTMMNTARLAVGVQGVALGERAYQQALAYAHERRQGRAPGAPPGEQSLIVELPDVRRMLLTMRALNEAMRCLVYVNAECLDLASHHPDEEVRQWRQELADLLTPITKGWCTDTGIEVTSLAIQVFGGMGYIEETGVAQHYRDARIAPIYEGTNGIQAMDLVGRKLPMREGGVISEFLAQIESTASEITETSAASLAGIGDRLASAHDALAEATTWLMRHGLEDPTNALAGATPYLRMCGIVAAGWLMARSALVAQQQLDAGGTATSAALGTEQLEQKIVTARFYCDQILPQAAGLVPAVTSGPRDLDAAAL